MRCAALMRAPGAIRHKLPGQPLSEHCNGSIPCRHRRRSAAATGAISSAFVSHPHMVAQARGARPQHQVCRRSRRPGELAAVVIGALSSVVAPHLDRTIR